MKLKAVATGIAGALCVLPLVQTAHARGHVRSVEFMGMEAPSTPEEKADVYTDAKMKVTYRRGRHKTYTKEYDLKYHQLMATTDVINGNMVGGLWDHSDTPLSDDYGQMASDAPDGTSLMRIPGMRAHKPWKNRALAMVIQFEYREVPPGYPDYHELPYTGHWSKLPATMGLAKLNQNKWTGTLDVVDYQPISFSEVNGGWIHCGSTKSAWNTHIGSEEYEPDAKVREGMLMDPPINLKADDSDDGTDIDSFSDYYFGDPDAANPYHYGLVPEVKVLRHGPPTVVKHYAPGRFAREMQEMASDNRTAIGGDDGANTGLFMFVADRAKDLSEGTIYAAKVTQTSAENGGSFKLQWIKLGHASDEEIQALVGGGIKFSDIFDFLPAGTTEDTTGYTKVTTYMGTEWLRLKSGMEKAAAFLETRRYAALMGATTEFSKMEYIGFNKKDRKFYIVISRAEKGMSDGEGDIDIAKNEGGLILEMSTAKRQRDTDGRPIRSRFVGTKLVSMPDLQGGWFGEGEAGNSIRDDEGNRCEQDKVCGPDNLRYVDEIRTLFIGEDTSRRNNNYVWAYNIDTRKLSRILSVPMYAEATGLTIEPNYGGHAYIMSNFQHPGDGSFGYDQEDVEPVIDELWDGKKKAAIGYIGTKKGALPAFK